MTYNIHPDTTIGTVSLTIRDMERSLRFYEGVLGFRVRERDKNTAYLGAGGDDLLILNERPDASSIESMAGLYHFAILVPSRLELAKSLRRLMETQTPVDGFADHLVSEAIYLPDPDGIGIEIYRDRPEKTWGYDENGIVMATEPLDIEDVLNELSSDDQKWSGLHQDTRIGHIHLNTGRNTEASKRFYTERLGFEVMVSIGGYWHFVAAGGYHHHIGLRPAGTRENRDSIGLRWYAIDLPDKTALQKMVAHLQSTGVDVSANNNGYHLVDHANNGILLRSR